MMKFEMIPCPVCGKPMPKKRLELGYNYCVNCSTEKPKVCMIEGTQDGDSTQDGVVIMTAQEAQAINRYKAGGLKLEHIEDEAPLNMQTFEEREEAAEAINQRDLVMLEGEFGYEISDRTAKDLETIGIVNDEDLEAELPGLEDGEE